MSASHHQIHSSRGSAGDRQDATITSVWLILRCSSPPPCSADILNWGPPKTTPCRVRSDARGGRQAGPRWEGVAAIGSATHDSTIPAIITNDNARGRTGAGNPRDRSMLLFPTLQSPISPQSTRRFFPRCTIPQNPLEPAEWHGAACGICLAYAPKTPATDRRSPLWRESFSLHKGRQLGGWFARNKYKKQLHGTHPWVKYTQARSNEGSLNHQVLSC
jgi:hypothetical protein